MNFFNDLLVNSHDGNYSKIVEVVANRFRHLPGCEVIIQNISENKRNVIVVWGKPELLLNAHLDTVVPVSNWETSPYQLIETEDKYYGLGTCDTKGNIFALYQAIKNVIPKNLMLLFSTDEESNSVESGVTHFLKTGYCKNIKRAIVCEPTGNEIGISHKGYYSFFLTVKSKAGHSSNSESLYENAIYKMSGYFKPLIKAGFNIGTIQGGSAGNIIASECTLLVSCRSFESYNSVYENLKEITGGEINISPKTSLPALNAAENISEYFNFAENYNPEPLNFWTEASLFQMAGIVPVVYGVGNIQQAHTANEFVTKESLAKGIEFFTRVILSENKK